MNIQDTYKEKGNKAADEIAQLAIKDDFVLQQVLEAAVSSNKRIKNAGSKTLKIISEIDPIKLYSEFNFFKNLLSSSDTILKWIAIDIIGNLTYVEK